MPRVLALDPQGPSLQFKFFFTFSFFFNLELFELRFTPCGRLEVAGELGETMPRAIALDPQSISSQFNVLFVFSFFFKFGTKVLHLMDGWR